MNQLYNLEAWKALITLKDTGSLSKTAEQLSTEVSTVSRLIAGIEKGLGRQLINRNKRPSILTVDGEATAESFREVLELHTQLINRLIADTGSMSGTIRISVAGGLMQQYLSPLLMKFTEKYPEINFDVKVGRLIDECISGTNDIASVSGEVTQQGVVILPRGRSVFIPVASPNYIANHGKPMRPEDLANHSGFVYSGPVREMTTELVKNGVHTPIHWRQSMHSTSILMIKRAVMDGMGIAVDLPLIHCADELRDGSLVPILDGWHRPPIPAYAVTSASAWHQKRIRVFTDWFCKEMQSIFNLTESIAIEVMGENLFKHYLDLDHN